MSIVALHYDIVPKQLANTWLFPCDVLVSIWPNPVNADACFTEAGFGDFGDQDDLWDTEFLRIALGLVMYLERYGSPTLQPRTQPPMVPRSFRSFFGIREKQEAPTNNPDVIIHALIDAAMDDRNPHAVVTICTPPAITLCTHWGHEIFWVAVTGRQSLNVPEMIEAIRGRLPVFRTQLNWDVLA